MISVFEIMRRLSFWDEVLKAAATHPVPVDLPSPWDLVDRNDDYSTCFLSYINIVNTD